MVFMYLRLYRFVDAAEMLFKIPPVVIANYDDVISVHKLLAQIYLILVQVNRVQKRRKGNGAIEHAVEKVRTCPRVVAPVRQNVIVVAHTLLGPSPRLR